MMMLLVAMCLGTAPQEGEEAPSSDVFQWARDVDEWDLSWEWGDAWFELSGEFDIEAFFFGDEAPGVHVEDSAVRGGDYSRSEEADSPEAGFRLQLFLDGGYEDWLEWMVEGRLDGTSSVGGNVGARIEQAFLTLNLMEPDLVRLRLGKFSAPLGNFIERHAPNRNPLTTWPLAYDHITAITSAGDSAASLEVNRDVPDIKDWYTPIWQAVYGTGAMGFGTIGDVTYAVAVMNSAPGTLPEDWDPSDDFTYPNVYLRASVPLDVTTQVGASWSRGPYKRGRERANAAGPGPGPGPPVPGAGPSFRFDASEYPQTLAGVDASFQLGKVQAFSEVYWTRFEGPLFKEAELWTWYVEGRYSILPGLFAATRLAQMYFDRVSGASGLSLTWDRDVSRVELGGGYFFTPNLFLKATGQLNYHMGGREPNDHMLMIQTGITF